MWSLLRRDLGEFVTTLKDDAAVTIKSALGEGEQQEEEEYDSSVRHGLYMIRSVLALRFVTNFNFKCIFILYTGVFTFTRTLQQYALYNPVLLLYFCMICTYI